MKKIILFIVMSVAFCSSSSAMMLSQLPSGVFTGAGFGVRVTKPAGGNVVSNGLGNDVFTADVSGEHQYAYQLMLEMGYQWARSSVWFPAFSAAIEYIYAGPSAMMGGMNRQVFGGSYNYQYNLIQHLILFNFKIDLVHASPLIPFINGDLGVAFNKTSQYSTTPLGGAAVNTVVFGPDSNTQFAYGGGAGVDYYLKKNIELELAYRYLRSGDAKTGVSNNTVVTGSSVITNRLSSNSVYLMGHVFF